MTQSSATEHSDLKAICHLVPQGVICLISALRFHGLTDENPHEISVALKHGLRTPVFAYPPVSYFSFSGEAFTHGVETHRIDGFNVKVYSIEKTIADCFKYRNKIGLDIALAALRESVKNNKIDFNTLWDTAKVCRVSKIIRPYMEAVQ